MRKILLLSCFAPSLAALTGCASTSSYVHSDATLGRVVVYRNGIAYFERTARLEGDSLRLAVPADKVDDFLKSLTVVDARTGEPAPIAYPTTAHNSETGLIDMKIALTGPTPSHDLKLSYVTEAPSWKPSYRLMISKDKKVNVQAWAIVDNTSGEDWQNVQLGVGSSSALSFRYDLRSVRMVQRETLHQDDLFAKAPPTGSATYGGQVNQERPQQQKKMVYEFSDDAVTASVNAQTAQNYRANEVTVVSRNSPNSPRKPAAEPPAPPPAPTVAAHGGGGKGAGRARILDQQVQTGVAIGGVQGGVANGVAANQPPPANQLDNMARTINGSSKNFVVEGYADQNDGDKYVASLERANRAREQLIRSGVDPNRIVAVGGGEKAGKKGGVSVKEAEGADAPDVLVQKQAQDTGSDPIGASHFESKAHMTVPRGTSAMVSILSTDTDGEVVYFYDAESQRGNGTYPFRAVRVRNPTDSVLEQGPVTVFGEGKFVGEGMTDPIPARSVAFIPFALDRQIVVERKDADVDRVSRIITVQRGVFSTEVQHTRRFTWVFTNRESERATVYVRHTVAQGYKLVHMPVGQEKAERLGNADLFRIEVEPNSKAELSVEEATPLFRSTDIRSSAGMEMISAFISSAAAEGPLKAAVGELLRLQREMANAEQQIQTTREQMEEYRARMDELHQQVVTLKVVKTAGPLMQNLEKKLAEVSDKLSKATIDLVALQEKLMVARIKFQDGVADLSLEKKAEPALPTKS